MRSNPGPYGLLCALFITAWSFTALAQTSNLVANPSFEQTADNRLANWTCEGDKGVVQTLSQDAGREGGHAAKLSCTSFERKGRTSYATLAQTGFARLEKGKWYRFSCWARQEGMAAGMVTAELYGDMRAANPGDTSLLFNQMSVRAGWQRFERLFQASCAGTDNAKLTIYFDFTGTLWVDDVEIVEVPAPQPVFTDVVPAATGRNLIPNGSFECGSDYWTSVGKKTGFAGGLTGLFGEVQSGEVPDGTKGLRIELGPGKTPEATFNFQAVCVKQTAPLVASASWIRVQRGKPYTLSAWMRSDTPGIPGVLRCGFGAPLGGVLEKNSPVALETSWKRFSFTLPAEGDYARVAVGPDITQTPDAAATVWIDGIQLEQADASTAFVPRESVEVGLNSNKYGNVFHAGDSIALTCGIANAESVPAEVKFRAEVRDYFDKVVADVSRRATCTGKARVDMDLPLGVNAPGYYRAEVTVDANGTRETRTLCLAVIEPYRESDSVFGLNHAPSTDQLCRLYKDAGVTWAREWVMEWNLVEPERGRFDFAAADRHVNRVLGTGMRMAQQLPPFPSANWNASAPEGAAEKAPKLPWGLCFYAPKDARDLERYATKVVEHFKDRFNTWEYVNEPFYTIHSFPNIDQMDALAPGLPGAHYAMKDYIRLLKVQHDAVKKADPTATTIAGIGGRPDLLSKEFFKAGGLKYVDKFDLHIYPGLRRPEGYIPQMEQLLRNMDANGGRKPIWMTEYCYYGTDFLPWAPYIMPPLPWAANRLLRDERQSADYAVRYAAIMLAHGVEKLFYHWGAAASAEPTDDCMLLESWMTAFGGIPRKAFAAQAALANVLGPKPEYCGSITGPLGYAFQCGPRAVLIAWAPEDGKEPGAWKAAPPADATALSVVGAPLPKGDVTLGESPVYITSATLDAKALLATCAFSPVR